MAAVTAKADGLSTKPPTDITQSRDWIAFFKDRFGTDGPFHKRLLEVDSVLLAWGEVVEIVEAQQLSEITGRVVVRFPVQKRYLNPGKTLQGGLQTAMFDAVSSWVFAFAKGWDAHTSRTLTTAYIRPAVEGEILLMECELVHAGKRLGLSKGILKREKDGAIISTCEHHKVNIEAETRRAKI